MKFPKIDTALLVSNRTVNSTWFGVLFAVVLVVYVISCWLAFFYVIGVL